MEIKWTTVYSRGASNCCCNPNHLLFSLTLPRGCIILHCNYNKNCVLTYVFWLFQTSTRSAVNQKLKMYSVYCFQYRTMEYVPSRYWISVSQCPMLNKGPSCMKRALLESWMQDVKLDITWLLCLKRTELRYIVVNRATGSWDCTEEIIF